MDENLPRKLKGELRDHQVETVQERGWSGVRNGELLRPAVSAGFDVLLPADRNLPYQQRLSALDLAVIVLAAPDMRLQSIRPLIPELLSTLATELQSGAVMVGSRPPP